MTAERLQLDAEVRAGNPRALLRTGTVPAVLYGHGIKNEALQLNSKAFSKVWQVAGNTSLVMLKTGKTEHPVLIREVQLHPLRDTVQHIDFLQVRMDEKIKASVPLLFVGQAVAVKDLSGVLVRNHDELELEALPQDLPHNISVDISSLTNFDQVIYVKDIALPKGVTVLTEGEEVVALVQPPRSEAELEALSEEVKEDVTAVEGVVKPEAPADDTSAVGAAKAEGESKKDAKKKSE